MKTIISAIFLLTCASPAIAGPLFKCVDATGKTSYQYDACAELPTDKSNYPIAATQITEKIAMDTVAKFYVAMNKRDSAAAMKFFAQTFTVKKNDRTGVIADKKRYVSTYIGDMVRATKPGAVQSATCKLSKAAKAAVILACVERVKIGNAQSDDANVDYTVIIENGEARFSHMALDGGQ
jgi:hypothetical protein